MLCTMLLVALLLALVIGLTLGLLGGGGSILTLPVLVYVLHLEPKEAIAASLVVVGTTALVSAVAHARAGNVNYRVGGIFAVFGMAGAFAGGRVAGLLPGDVLLGAFAAMMTVTALAMMRPKAEPTEEKRAIALGRVIASALVVGAAAGLVGAGGGFLVVPALVLFGGLDTRRAIGTSLMVIALQSFAGLAGHIGHAHLDLSLVGIVTGAAIVGSLAGTALAKKLPAASLRSGFAWFVLAMAIFMVGRQLSIAIAAIVALVALVLITFFRLRAHLSAKSSAEHGRHVEQNV